MAHVITGPCCSDTVCITVCPVNCISPTPDSPEFLRSGMLHINPEVCIDCGACADSCPVSAILPDDLLEGIEKDFIGFNKEYFDLHNTADQPLYFPLEVPLNIDLENKVRVAVVGSGPSAMYAINSLNIAGVKNISVFEKSSNIGGLVNTGVAPDRSYTKQFINLLNRTFKDIRVDLFLDTKVGEDISVEDLKSSHDAVIFATGASADRMLNVSGEDLPECYGIRNFAGWYNGVEEFRDTIGKISGPRAVVVGHGNTAFDAARFLISDADYLNSVRMPESICEKLENSGIREVVLLGRDNPNGPAFSRSALHELKSMPGVRVVIDADSKIPTEKNNLALNWLIKEFPKEKIDYSKKLTAKSERRIIIRFGVDVAEITGKNHVSEVVGTDHAGKKIIIPAKTVIRSIGYKNIPNQGLPFDEKSNRVPNEAGNILVDGKPAAGMYVTGWIKRGTIGGIGHNKSDSSETVGTLITAANEGKLPEPTLPYNEFVKKVATANPAAKIIKKNNLKKLSFA